MNGLQAECKTPYVFCMPSESNPKDKEENVMNLNRKIASLRIMLIIIACLGVLLMVVANEKIDIWRSLLVNPL